MLLSRCGLSRPAGRRCWGDNVEQPASIDVVYLFEQFRLDRSARQLLQQDNRGKVAPVFLGSRAFDVLLALVERSGEVVSKAQILDTVWHGLAVEEFNLNVQISAVRRAIDNGRGGPSLIRTLGGEVSPRRSGCVQE